MVKTFNEFITEAARPKLPNQQNQTIMIMAVDKNNEIAHLPNEIVATVRNVVDDAGELMGEISIKGVKTKYVVSKSSLPGAKWVLDGPKRKGAYRSGAGGGF